MRSSNFLALSLLLVLSSNVAAQGEAPVLERGIRARVDHSCAIPDSRTATLCRSTGQLAELAPDTVVLDVASAGRVGVSLSTVQRFEMSLGPKGHTRLGGLVGLLLGLGATYRTLYSGGSTSLCDGVSNQDAVRPSECMGWVVVGGLAGAGIGALIGTLVRIESWQEIPLYQLRVRPRSGTERGLSIGFVINTG